MERENRTFREKFYSCSDLLANNITELRIELKAALWEYTGAPKECGF
jgi:hypothetical protein